MGTEPFTASLGQIFCPFSFWTCGPQFQHQCDLITEGKSY